MSHTEFLVLELLMPRPEVVFSRDKLLAAALDGNHGVKEHSVDACILRLRQKIEDYPARPVLIDSVRGSGWAFRDPDRAPASRAAEAKQLPTHGGSRVSPGEDSAIELR